MNSSGEMYQIQPNPVMDQGYHKGRRNAQPSTFLSFCRKLPENENKTHKIELSWRGKGMERMGMHQCKLQ